MFTGIIEASGTVVKKWKEGSNVHFLVRSDLTPELKVDQSVAHNGVCLTVADISREGYTVTAVEETLQKTNLGGIKEGDVLNLERSLRIGDRLDGHFVQGHVDALARCTDRRERNGSWLFRFEYPAAFAALVVEKGSVCLNGVSLTVFDVRGNGFTVTIIPYTFEHTNFRFLNAGDTVNAEFDILGKYLDRRAGLDKP